MFTGIYQSIIILATVISFYITNFLLTSRYDKQRQAEGSGISWGFTTIMIVVAVFLIVQPTLLPGLGLYTDAWWGRLLQIVGILLLLGALSLHWWARIHLRQFYAERVEVQPGHCLVDSGPYAYVRHPMFTSYFMFASGLLLVNPALPTLVIAIYAFWDFNRAARQGEKLLAENLPGYTDYMSRTPRFLPRFRGRLGGK